MIVDSAWLCNGIEAPSFVLLIPGFHFIPSGQHVAALISPTPRVARIQRSGIRELSVATHNHSLPYQLPFPALPLFPGFLFIPSGLHVAALIPPTSRVTRMQHSGIREVIR